MAPLTYSLRKRLILIPTAIVILVMAAASAILTRQARLRIEVERSSSANLAAHLIDQAIANLPSDTETPLQVMAQLIRALPDLRHVHLYVTPDRQLAILPDPPASGWLRNLLQPAPWQKWVEIPYRGGIAGYVLILANPDDEIAELKAEILFFGGLLSLLTLLFIALVGWSVSKALRPIQLLSAGLGHLQKGEFNASLPPFVLSELTPVGEKFNDLAKALRDMRSDNQFLVQKLIAVQETERTLLAREFHDELGPCLFGIKAQAACIARPSSDSDKILYANAILKMANDLQKLNRRILGRLTPLALTDCGLAAALNQLIGDWRAHLPDIDWQLRIGELVSPAQQDLTLTIYRVVQETLTNAARHAKPACVTVEIESGPAKSYVSPDLTWTGRADDEVIHLAIGDDGHGFGPEARPGFGLLGVGERVRGHGGVLALASGPTGTLIAVLLPQGQFSVEAR